MSEQTTDDPTTTTNNAEMTTEPGITQRNSATIRGEEILEHGGTVESNLDDTTSTRTKLGAIPSSYGAGGGLTTPDDDGGAGI